MTAGILELGGTHVSAATVATDGRCSEVLRRQLDATASAAELLDALVAAAGAALNSPADWVVAVPGPFDYRRGIALYAQGKFDSLHGLDIGSVLAERLGGSITFVNDADAFALGAWVRRRSVSRLVGLTLGTGIGSGWIRDGVAVLDGAEVPPEGSAHLLTVRGEPLESWVSRRAICQSHLAAGGASFDVLEICELARTGDRRAENVLREAMTVLGDTLAPWLARFAAERLVVGGSIARSWDVLGPWFTAVVETPPVDVETDTELVAVTGAAWLTGQLRLS